MSKYNYKIHKKIHKRRLKNFKLNLFIKIYNRRFFVRKISSNKESKNFISKYADELFKVLKNGNTAYKFFYPYRRDYSIIKILRNINKNISFSNYKIIGADNSNIEKSGKNVIIENSLSKTVISNAISEIKNSNTKKYNDLLNLQLRFAFEKKANSRIIKIKHKGDNKKNKKFGRTSKKTILNSFLENPHKNIVLSEPVSSIPMQKGNVVAYVKNPINSLFGVSSEAVKITIDKIFNEAKTINIAPSNFGVFFTDKNKDKIENNLASLNYSITLIHTDLNLDPNSLFIYGNIDGAYKLLIIENFMPTIIRPLEIEEKPKPRPKPKIKGK